MEEIENLKSLESNRKLRMEILCFVEKWIWDLTEHKQTNPKQNRRERERESERPKRCRNERWGWVGELRERERERLILIFFRRFLFHLFVGFDVNLGVWRALELCVSVGYLFIYQFLFFKIRRLVSISIGFYWIFYTS